MAKTVDRLLSGIKRRAIVPSSQPLLDDDDILEMSDDVVEEEIVPLIMSVRQDFFVTTDSEDIAADTAAYDIPYRAIGRTLRDLKLYDGTNYRDLALVALEDEHLFSSGTTPHSFYFRGDKVVLVPEPASALTSGLQFWYNLAPSRHVVVADAALVVSKTTTQVTVSSVPSTITTGTVVDFVQGISGNSILGMDKAVTNATSTVLTFASGDVPTGLVAGDYVSVQQTTPVVQLPNEVTNLVETLTAKRILNALGDFEGAAALDKEAAKAEKNVRLMLEPRVVGENTVIINRRGLLRGSRTRHRKGLIY
jgi:hypothetical protein